MQHTSTLHHTTDLLHEWDLQNPGGRNFEYRAPLRGYDYDTHYQELGPLLDTPRGLMWGFKAHTHTHTHMHLRNTHAHAHVLSQPPQTNKQTNKPPNERTNKRFFKYFFFSLDARNSNGMCGSVLSCQECRSVCMCKISKTTIIRFTPHIELNACVYIDLRV